MVEIDALNFHFRTRSVFLGLSMRFEPGLTWLRGSNGRGKTTLLRLLGGQLAPAAGSMRLDGIDAQREPLAWRRASFYCGGEAPALDWLTVNEWLELHLALYEGADRAALRAHLAAFRLDGVPAQPVSALSLGQYKKLQLALALALPARLLLIDEPFNGLDAQAVELLEQELSRREAARQGCIVLTSHLAPRIACTHTLDLDRQAGVL
ncbi:ABC transporter ATP-binding protein NatA [Massilia sp. Bi118]|uniref:ABC transporter ATP-binding protein n=1 Tax=Massilia sp. Bi118 TaxID=2822346 RepID=UPI001E1A1432|nr:ATP-binding cassette domain-containing protein [Massilia sp. Bi118]CAH0253916.1 ABC transporter ATP-binding protein NatA [Massilia sp. Bi118]